MVTDEWVVGWRLKLWRHWNDGNYPMTAAILNRYVEDYIEMTGKRQNGSKGNAEKTNFYFVNCAVDASMWENVAEAYPLADDVFIALAGLLDDGYKVGFSVNTGNNLTTCSITDKREGSQTNGACLTAAADGWYDALRVGLYKFTMLLHGDLANATKADGGGVRIM